VETDKEYKVIADVPGVDPDNMRVWIQDYALFIKANRKNPYEEDPSEQPKLHHQALPYGEIERRIQLPKNAGLEMAQTEYKYGVLKVCFPKLPQAVEPEHKKLPINVA
jgi:HSP20 family protein